MRRPRSRISVYAALAAVTVAVGVGSVVATPAYAVPGQTDGGSTTANVEVGSAITLTDLTPTLTLTAIPGDTPTTGAAPVGMTVTTNNFAGYTVTVEPETATLVPAIVGNTDTIPVLSLEVQGPVQAAAWEGLVFGTPTLVVTKAAPSEVDGDPITNAYRLTVPFVRPDTYSATLDYVATTL